MRIIIPLAGQGARFMHAGHRTIKPLIEIEGRPMIEHVVNMFPREEDFLFICNNEHLENTNLREVIMRLKPSGKVFGIDTHKKGPAYSVLLAQGFIDDDKPAIVNYCDFSTPWDYADFKKRVEENGCDGCISAYTGFHPHLLRRGLYAGVRIDDKDYLTEIIEKHSFTSDKTKSLHSAGTYYFKDGVRLKRYFHKLLEKDINVRGEYYVSSAYQLMKEDGLSIYVYKLDYFLQWGTPEELAEYLRWSDYFRRAQQTLQA